jgi:hypothetical protein
MDDPCINCAAIHYCSTNNSNSNPNSNSNSNNSNVQYFINIYRYIHVRNVEKLHS